STDNVGIVRWTWTFSHLGAEVRLEGMTPMFVFIEVGVYTVTLEVADPTGHTDTDTMTVTVLDVDAPLADAGQNQTIFEGNTATFDGSGSEDNVGIVSWTWLFVLIGFEETLEGETATFVFDEAGDYLVRLVVEDARGNSDMATMVVTVEPMPPPPNGDRDPDWSSMALYAGVAAAIVIAALVALLLMRRRGTF
ncbi:MAG: PKD domain-containing protein, partial [Thermoplasmata archaeon]|nr:PKD domain-containing protein [Thermoplasmata archaeon]